MFTRKAGFALRKTFFWGKIRYIQLFSVIYSWPLFSITQSSPGFFHFVFMPFNFSLLCFLWDLTWPPHYFFFCLSLASMISDFETVFFPRIGHSQARCCRAGETNGPHCQDRRGHRRYPPLRHYFPRSGSPHEEEVRIPQSKAPDQ